MQNSTRSVFVNNITPFIKLSCCQVRGKAISLHSQAITDWCLQYGAYNMRLKLVSSMLTIPPYKVTPVFRSRWQRRTETSLDSLFKYSLIIFYKYLSSFVYSFCTDVTRAVGWQLNFCIYQSYKLNQRHVLDQNFNTSLIGFLKSHFNILGQYFHKYLPTFPINNVFLLLQIQRLTQTKKS